MILRNTRLFLMLLSLIILLSACANAKTTVPDQTSAKSPQKTIYIGSLDVLYYDSADALYKEADLVIRGKVVDSRVEWLSHVIKPTAGAETDPNKNPGYVNKALTTIFTVDIVNFYKGDTGKKTIEVMQLGGETETEIYRYEDQQELTKNTEYVMFLGKSKQRDNAAWLIAGGIQSLHLVDGNKLITSADNKWALTFEDLSKLAEIK